jgi:hypothetical protein
MSLKTDIRFQKLLRAAADMTSSAGERANAEAAARRLMAACNIDPVELPSKMLCGQESLADNPLLKTLREEWHTAHPSFEYYVKGGSTYRYKHPKRKPKPVNHHQFDGLFDECSDKVNELAEVEFKAQKDSKNAFEVDVGKAFEMRITVEVSRNLTYCGGYCAAIKGLGLDMTLGATPAELEEKIPLFVKVICERFAELEQERQKTP